MGTMILIIDGNNLFFRNYAASSVADSNGTPVGGVVGCIRSLKWIIREIRATRVFWVWDAPGGSKKRRAIVSDYKAGRKPSLNREADETMDEGRKNLIWQLERTEQFLKYLGVVQISVQDIEADDAIAYLCGMFEGHQKVVVSSDKDMWQLVNETTTVYWPTKKVYITPGNFREQTHYPPENYVLARAISGKGDTSDNVHGIKGLGDKTIEKLFPVLTLQPTTLDQLLLLVRDQLQRNEEKAIKLTVSEKRWYQTLLENADLVRRNIQVMQLTSPIISAHAGTIIRNAAEDIRPEFNITKFKLALINSGIQLTDQDIFVAFQEFRVRATNAIV
jgi:DNA polymerase-1